MKRKQSPYMFFKTHAGYSYDPKTETREEGKQKCARAMAQAEKLFLECEGEDIWFEVEEDFDESCLGDCENIEDYHSGKYQMYSCYLWRKDESARNGRRIILSLHAVSVAEGESDPYLRVIRAELALEASDELNDYLAEQTEQQVTE
jgi:hypothetical protein